MKKKYLALHIVAGFYMFAAIIILLGGLGSALMVIFTPRQPLGYINGAPISAPGQPPLVSGIIIAALSILASVSLLAFSELIQLLVDLAESSRETAHYLKQRRQPNQNRDLPLPIPRGGTQGAEGYR